jgi:two-component system, chemotaxis family, protein-glutamate methylesterase/glutaminase
MSRIKVFILDDSALMRQLLTDILSRDRQLEVVGAAGDPYAAWRKMRATRPDVLTLDVEMPRMDGVTFLEKLMAVHPMPVLMVSSLTERGCATTLRALELGAVDFVTKPKIDVADGTVLLAETLIEKVKIAAQVRFVPAPPAPLPLEPLPPSTQTTALLESTQKVVAVGASTGGTQALEAMLVALPADAPGLVIVQHMPEKFTTSFAERLNDLCRINVKEAKSGDRILPGHALLAPGNFHMRVVRSGASYGVRLDQEVPVNRHRPSVDVLFHSCAHSLGQSAVGVIMTGMGDDGAQGMLSMRQAGAHTIAQDEASCVVFGMPKEAIVLGGVAEVVPLRQIALRALIAAGHTVAADARRDAA